MGQEAVGLVEHFLGHAVGTSEVAAVRHGDAKIVKRSPKRVDQRSVELAGRKGALDKASLERAVFKRAMVGKQDHPF